MQQLAMLIQIYIDIVISAYPMKKKDQQRVAAHGLFDQFDHIITVLSVDAIAIDIIQVDLADGRHCRTDSTGSYKVFSQSVIKRRISDLQVPTGIRKSSAGLGRDGI